MTKRRIVEKNDGVGDSIPCVVISAPKSGGDEELNLANESNNLENQGLSDEALAEKLQIEELVDMEKNEYIENVENTGNDENVAVEGTAIL
ncbi:hypothetical protein GUJ93_ZPchr0011g27553 [Zizania palustris]|uniref:Uncharacterized protein n=1 Tax=Zizania palustris TaxID=103762 RepID=A0A8J6BQ16_ZIZPA|nr:hypothetical protein GUJ93_ZPchr0011g27553 [Zizania palustris]